MSRSINQHRNNWSAPNKILKESTNTKRRAAEREFLHKVKEDPGYCESNVCPTAKELENMWNWD